MMACRSPPRRLPVLRRAREPQAEYPADAAAAAPPAPVANGAIFQAAQRLCAAHQRPARRPVGDVLTIVLVERTQGTSSSTSNTEREGIIGLTPPATGPLVLLPAGTDVAMGGQNDFQGRGQTGQSNSLIGEITVTVAEVYPNGTMRVRGEKQLRINRGNEFIRMSGHRPPGRHQRRQPRRLDPRRRRPDRISRPRRDRARQPPGLAAALLQHAEPVLR